MKAKSSSEVEELGVLLENVNLQENLNENKGHVLEEKLSNVSLNISVPDEQNGPVTSREGSGVFELDGLKRVLEEVEDNNNNTGEDDKDELEQSLAQNILRKRGPQRKSRASPHTSSPYIPTTSVQQSNRGTKCQLFYAGGTVVNVDPPVENHMFTYLNQEPLIPDLEKLLDSNILYPESAGGTSSCEQEISTVDEDYLEQVLKEVFPVSDNNSNQDFLPDLGVFDDLRDILDPRNLEDPSHESDPEIVTQRLEDQFSPTSTESGYTSDVSYADSPPSVPTVMAEMTTFCINISSPVVEPPTQVKVVQAKKKRNKYFDGLDEKNCDKFRRAILRKATENGLNQKDTRNRTLLHLAIEVKNEEYAVVFINMLQKSFQNGTGVKCLPSFTDLPSFLNQEDDFGRTALLVACMFNLPRVVEYLLDCGASPLLNKRFFTSASVLHYVCERGSRFKEVADILCTKASSCLNMPNASKETPLHIAVGFHGLKHEDAGSGTNEIADNVPLIHLLLDKNAKSSAQDVFGRTPLHWVIISKNFDLLDMFYSQARDYRQAVNLKNVDGRTILHSAALCTDLPLEKHKSLIQKLVVCHASPLIKDNMGKYPNDLVPKDRKSELNLLNGRFTEMLSNLC